MAIRHGRKCVRDESRYSPGEKQNINFLGLYLNLFGNENPVYDVRARPSDYAEIRANEIGFIYYCVCLGSELLTSVATL